MTRWGQMNRMQWDTELLARAAGGPCSWCFYDVANERYAMYETEAEARAAYPTLPGNNWTPVVLHRPGCEHPDRLDYERRVPSRVDRIGQAFDDIERSRRSSPN